jgi:hypothetical protein
MAYLRFSNDCDVYLYASTHHKTKNKGFALHTSIEVGDINEWIEGRTFSESINKVIARLKELENEGVKFDKNIYESILNGMERK